MEEIVFNLQRFAGDNSGLTYAEKKAARESSLPHLRMISNIAKVPLFSAFVSMLEEKKTETEFLSSTVAPVYNLIGALYKRQYGKNGVLKLMEEAAIFTSTVKIIDSVLDICDNLAGADAAALEDNILKIADESVKIGNKLKLENYNGIFSTVGSAALSYGLTVLASIDNLTPEAQTKIYKAFVKVGGATIKSVFKEVFETREKFTAPFGLVDMGMSVLIGIIEGVSQMGIREEYYSDDGLPEDIAHKEALLDALSSGVHEAFHTYLQGADDIAFKVGQAFGEGCKWLAHAFSGDFSYEITINDMNYMEFVREIAKRGEYNSSSNADTINVSDSGVSIYAQDGDDYIENFYNNVTILAGHGKDTVSSYGGAKYNSILGGNDSDYLYIKNSSSTIEGGKDKDRFFITGDKNIVYGNDGDDQVSIKGSGNFFSGGAGDDLMLLDGAKNVVIEYTQGDGTDVIYGYDTSDVIKVKGEYSILVSGNDKIIQFNKGGIIVKDAKDLKLNINTIDLEEGETLPEGSGEGFTPYTGGIVFAPRFQDNGAAMRGTSTNDRIENTLSNIMIYSGDCDDTIINYGKNVTINAGNGNDHVENYGDSVKINGGDGNDYIYSEGYKVNINAGDGNHNIISVGDGRNTIFTDNYYDSSYNQYNTIEAGTGSDLIRTSGNYNFINAGSGRNSITLRGGQYNTIVTGKGDDTLTFGDDANNNIIIFGGGNDLVVNYHAGDTIETTSTLTRTTIGADVILSDGTSKMTLQGASDKKINTATLSSNDSVYKILVADKTVGDTVPPEGVPIDSEPIKWKLKGTTATYGKLITLKGIKSLSGILLNGNVITLSKAALGTANVTVNDGYALVLSNDVSKPSTSESWSLNGTTASYNQTTSEGYTLANDGKSVVYSAKTTKASAMIKGLKSGLKISNGKISGISLKGNVVTLSKAVLGTDKVTINDSYNLKLGSDVAKPSTTKAWSVSKTTATYKQTTTAGYTLADNAINYSKKSVETLATIKGLKSGLKASNGKISGISLKGNVVTLSKAVLGTSKVTINDGYNLNLGSDVAKPSTTKAWSVSKTTATLKQTTTAGYAFADNAVTYSKNSSKTLATVTGVKNLKGISASDKIVTLKAKSLNNKVSIDGNGYEFNFAAGNYKGSAISGSKKADIITSRGKNLSVDGGAGDDVINVFGTATSVTGGKGNDTMTSGLGGNVFFYADGDGNDVIADFAEDDKIKITKGTAKVTTSGDDVIVKVGKGSIKLAGAAGQDISIINSKGKEKIYATTAPSYALAYWFDEDDNNFGADNQLGSIVKKSSDTYSLGKLETSTNLTTEKNIIAYSGKK